MKFRALGILLTRKCTAECDICCFSCSPKVNDRMSTEDILSYIQQAQELKTITTVGISGGEPFIYFEDLLYAIKIAKSYKFRITCSTNGFWAENKVIAKKKFSRLIEAGLNHLSVSVDGFHSHFVPYENIKKIFWK